MTLTAHIKSYGWTVLFCLAIAVLLRLIGDTPLLTGSLISLCIGLSITTSLNLLEPWAARVLNRWLAPIPVTLLGLCVGLLIGGWLVLNQPLYFFTEDFSSLYLGIFFGAIGYIVLGVQFNARAEYEQKLANAEADKAAQSRQIAETQLQLLQAQIEPHFLFNTLSNITSMVRTDPTGAERMLENLSHLLRSNLRRTREPNTTLAQEVSVLRAYLDIHSIRMGERLHYAINIEPELAQQAIPPLLIQPLVENAIQHGIEPAELGGSLTVDISRNDTHILCRITDTGVGIDANRQSVGVGLSNIRERLVALYQQRASLSLRDNTGGGVIAELSLPLAPSSPSVELTLEPNT